ncbi:MAG: flagellar hook-basal body protein [Bacilli bacterium]
MIKGFYTAASGMIANQRRSEILTNNVANVNTPGYKGNLTVMRAFPEMLMEQMGTPSMAKPGEESAKTPIGRLNSGVYVQETIPNFAQGSLRETNFTTDLALVDQQMPRDPETNQPGSVLYTIQNEAGEVRYTRNGSFTVSPDGYLTTKDGYYVLDTNNERIAMRSADFKVSASGEIVDGNENRGQIGVVFTQNTGDLIREDAGLFRTEEPLPSAFDSEGVVFSIYQGFEERSNVDMNAMMGELMTSYRAFETNQRVVQTLDRSLEKTVNELGRIR